MRLSCGCPIATATQLLLPAIEQLGVTPIVTNLYIRVVYEGDDHDLGAKIVNLFAAEHDHDITVLYDKEEQPKEHGATETNPKQPKRRHKKTRNRSRR